VRYEGPASPANFARLVGTPLAVGDLVDVFLGVPPERRPLVPPTLERDGAEYVLTIAYAGGTQLVRFAADTLAITSVEERRDGDPTPLKVTFGDYVDGIAHALDLDGGRGSTVSVVFDEVEAMPRSIRRSSDRRRRRGCCRSTARRRPADAALSVEGLTMGSRTRACGAPIDGVSFTVERGQVLGWSANRAAGRA
jgi:hypothetical protein